MDVAEIQARHLKAETVDCYFTEAGSGQVKEKVFCDAKTQAHADRGYLLKRIAELEARLEAVKGLPTKAEEEAAGGSDYWKGWVDACRWIRQAALGGDDE